MTIRKFALIRCQFSDVGAKPNHPESYYQNLFTRGAGGALDYWRDVSWGQIDLTGSAVYGWWPSQYSFVKDGARARGDFIAEARRLATSHNVNLSSYYGVMAFFNANIDGGNNGGPDMAGGIPGQWGQDKWTWCKKCQAIVYSGFTAGPCPKGGQHDISNAQAFNYALALNEPAGTPSQDKWAWCKKCQALNYGGGSSIGACSGGGTHDNSGSGNYALKTGAFGPRWDARWKWCDKCQVLVVDANAPCAGSGNHDTSRSQQYCVLVTNNDFNLTAMCHELGHCQKLQHSWLAKPEKSYGNPWDLMSAMDVKSLSTGPYQPEGPGLEAANLDTLGIDMDPLLWKGPPAGTSAEQLQLLPLNSFGSGQLGFLAARMPKGDRTYYAEFRQSTGWDAAFGEQAVFINELRLWNLCRKCQQLTAVTDATLGPCAAKGQHDHTGSANYTLLRDVPALKTPPTTESGWRRCSKCRTLVQPKSSGPCPGGGEHAYTGSGSYTMVVNSSWPGTQTKWHACGKCQAMNYAGGAALGACQAGGTHDNSQSGEYSLLAGFRTPFLLGDASEKTDWQPGKVFLAKDTGMCVVVHGFGKVGNIPSVSVTLGDAQSDWKLCGKCEGLFYAGSSNGVCPVGGAHAASGTKDYSLLHDVQATSGQNGWRWCKKCQGLAYTKVSHGVCPAKGTHDTSTSDDYVLLHSGAMTDAQANWRWCNKCQGLLYAGTSHGVCPADGGAHNVQSDDYNMIDV